MFFLLALISCIAARLAGGAGQGSLFGAVAVVTLLSPKLKNVPSLILAIALTNVSLILPVTMYVAGLFIIATYAVALAGLRRWLGYSLTLLLGFGWLTCPIWLGDHITQPIVNLHILFTINKLTFHQGLWPEKPLMYQWSALGQDVSYSLPSSIFWCIIVHLGIATGNLIPRSHGGRDSRRAITQ